MKLITKTIKKYLMTESFDFSSTQVNINDASFKNKFFTLLSQINDDEVYTKPYDNSYGKEDNPHITIKYGIHTTNAKKIRRVLNLSKINTINITLDNITHFEADEFDVLKIDVNSNDLHYLNKLIKTNVNCTDTFPVYHPHLTLAYMKKGYIQKYINNDEFKGLTLEVKDIMFSSKDGKKYFFTLGE